MLTIAITLVVLAFTERGASGDSNSSVIHADSIKSMLLVGQNQPFTERNSSIEEYIDEGYVIELLPIRSQDTGARDRESGLSSAPIVGRRETVEGTATHYGESYNGQTVGCPPITYPASANLLEEFGLTGDGVYRSSDWGITAVGPANYKQWPCGTILAVCASDEPSCTYISNGKVNCMPGLRCVIVIRVDACPGCGIGNTHIVDLSESGLERVCGRGTDTCAVTVTKLD